MEQSELNLTSVLKKINTKYSDNLNNLVVQIGVPDLKSIGTLSLGSPALDFCLYNSLPEGTFIEINGLEGSGKTTLSFLIASDYIRKEQERNPDNPRKILFVDAECATDKGWAKQSTGYNMDDKKVPTIYYEGSGQSAEEYFDDVISLIRTGEIGLIIFDSLSMLAGSQVNEQSLKKEQMGGIAKPLTNFVKRSIGLLHKYKTTFIGINGLSENIGGYGDPLVAGGGKAWKRACMVRLRCKRGDFFDIDNNIVMKKDAQSPAGHIIEVYVEKTKVCRWDRKLGRLHLNYTTGVDLLWDTIDVAINLGLIAQINQMTFGVIDPDSGEILKDNEGNDLKIKGRKNLKPYFIEHKELWKNIYDKCYEKLAKKDDPSIIAFEKMLNLDMTPEKLGFDINEENEY